jgi:uncharacterized protein YdeI (YjbR/CyaY-like superfamily)
MKDEREELPLGFGMALAQDEAAMRRFAELSPEGRRAAIAGAHQVRSKEEMQQYVEQFSRGE